MASPDSTDYMTTSHMKINLSVFATHPIQYQVPIWRGLAENDLLNVTVNYFSDISIRGGVDPGFGIAVAWDIPLLEGYAGNFVSKTANVARPYSIFISNVGQLLERQKPDVILVQGYVHGFVLQLILAARKLGIKIINRAEFSDGQHDRSLLKEVAREAYLKWFYRRMDALCYVGQTAKNHLERYVENERLFFSPYSIDASRFRAGNDKDGASHNELRRRIGASDDDFVILFAGKLIDIKRPMLLLDALDQMNKEGLILVIVGDGPLREQVRRLGEQVLGNKCNIAGFINQSEIGQYYAAADVLVLPSARETWGLVVNEAMALGVPAVVSNTVGCAPDLVLPSVTGAIFENGDANALAVAIETVRRQSAEHPGQLRKNVLAHIRSYSVEASVDGIVAAIESVVHH